MSCRYVAVKKHEHSFQNLLPLDIPHECQEIDSTDCFIFEDMYCGTMVSILLVPTDHNGDETYGA